MIVSLIETGYMQAKRTASQQESNPAAISAVSLLIMEAIAGAPEDCGVTALAAQLAMPKARIHRHLSALREAGYVSQNPRTSRYGVGWRLYLLARRLVSRFDIDALTRPVLERLRDTVDQTVALSTRHGDEVIVISFLPGRRGLEVILQPGTKLSLNGAAQGKVALAFSEPELLEHATARPLTRSTEKTIIDATRLRKEIATIRRRGWADAPEQAYAGINAIAAPVFYSDGALFGAVAIVSSIHYLPKTPDRKMVDALLGAANELRAVLGANKLS
jgi:IclR family transcriptional regulator, carbohydrate utilization repressor